MLLVPRGGYAQERTGDCQFSTIQANQPFYANASSHHRHLVTHASFHCHRKSGEPAKSIDSRRPTQNHPLHGGISIGFRPRIKPHYGVECSGKTGSWRNASNIPSVPSLASNQSGNTQTVVMGRHGRMVSFLTNCQDHSPHGKGNKINIRKEQLLFLISVAVVPATAPVSNKPVLVVLTEGKQRHGKKSRSIAALSVGSEWCPFISLWQTSLVTNSASRGGGLERYSFTNRTAAQKTVGGTVDGLNWLRQRAEH